MEIKINVPDVNQKLLIASQRLVYQLDFVHKSKEYQEHF